MSSMLRSIARNRAKMNMRKKGYTQFCKHGRGISSTFADEWRNFAHAVVIDARKRQVARGGAKA